MEGGPLLHLGYRGKIFSPTAAGNSVSGYFTKNFHEIPRYI